ncbi:hypothetical protein LINPERPRIM_LOCUS1053 [Linum perenne]
MHRSHHRLILGKSISSCDQRVHDTGWRHLSWRWYRWGIHIRSEIRRREFRDETRKERDAVHGEFRRQHEWFVVLHYHDQYSPLGWEACGVWQGCESNGSC